MTPEERRHDLGAIVDEVVTEMFPRHKAPASRSERLPAVDKRRLELFREIEELTAELRRLNRLRGLRSYAREMSRERQS
jgi:hypothetical protein